MRHFNRKTIAGDANGALTNMGNDKNSTSRNRMKEAFSFILWKMILPI